MKYPNFQKLDDDMWTWNGRDRTFFRAGLSYMFMAEPDVYLMDAEGFHDIMDIYDTAKEEAEDELSGV